MAEAVVIDRPTLQEPEERTVIGHALGGAASRVSIWSFTWAVQLSIAFLPAYAMYLWFERTTAHRYSAEQALHHLDVVFRSDHAAALGTLDGALGAQLVVAVLVYYLASVFFAGGWLQVLLERTQGQSMRRFVYGGARYFWRFLRLLVLSLLLLALFRWLLYGTPWQGLVLGAWLGVPEHDRAALETLGSEQTVRLLTWLQDGLFALLFGSVLVWGDYTRTRLALQDTSSTLWAGLLTFFTLLRHPIRTLRPMLGLLGIEALLLVALAYLAGWLTGGLEGTASLWRLILLLILFQLAILPRHIIRGARYLAAITVSKEVVRPLFRPDPWKDSIGGPGGPRYPLEEGDEYGVSL